jgi:HK97 family phage major capsid protein
MTIEDLLALTQDEIASLHESEIRENLAALDTHYLGRSIAADPAAKQLWNSLNGQLEEFEMREKRIRELYDRGSYESSTDSFRTRRPMDREDPPSGLPVNNLRSRALAANERAVFLPERSREHMEAQLRDDDDPEARLSRYTIELSNRNYLRAFASWMNDPQTGPQLWTTEERDSVRRVKAAERAMNLGTGSQGGFLVPYELDPAIVIASGGYVDPMRQIARVVTTAQNEKRFVTSLGVTSSWDPESQEVSDDTPALLQPAIVTKKAATFVPVTIELFEDADLATEIAKLFADSKAALEADGFTTGAGGANVPRGIITALVAIGGATVIATGSNVLAQGDLYTNQAALPARWRPNAKWSMNLSIINGYRQLPQATGLNYSIVNDDGPRPKALGWEIFENNGMDATLTGAAADYLVLSGDFQQYAIVDRVGATIEFVPHLFGAAGRPLGQRGFYQHWRVGGDVLVGDAFRLSNFST